MTRLRLVFMGTPDFAVPALQALAQAGHDVLAVYCQPPKPAGRGHQIQKTPVHLAAEALGIPVQTPKSLRPADEAAKLAALAPDAIVVAAYGLILPQSVLDIPRLGCLNIHGSLLPRWRGAAPIHRALLAGDQKTGITIMRMEAGLDTGPMYIKDSVPLTDTTTAQDLHDALAAMGARLIVTALDGVAEGSLTPTPQPDEGACYAAKLTKADGVMDFRQPAEVLARQVRALNPWPGAYFHMPDGQTVKVLAAEKTDETGAPGCLLDDQLTVACGTGALRLLSVQKAGKNKMAGDAFLRGERLEPGTQMAALPA